MRADYLALRTEAVLLETQYAALWRLSGPGAWPAVDALLSCDAAVRSGRLRHGLVLDEGGRIAADAYLGRLGDDLLIWCEPPELDLTSLLPAGADVQLECVTSTRRILGVHGPFAWEVVARAIGPQVIGMPFQTVMETELGLLVRAGRTGEYGFDLAVDSAKVEATVARLDEAAARLGLPDGVTRSTDALSLLDLAALESGFFSIRHDPSPACPLEAQLRWRLLLSKPFRGRDGLLRRTEEPQPRRLMRCVSPMPWSGASALYLDGAAVGQLVRVLPCPALSQGLGLALVATEVALPGLWLSLEREGSASVRLIAAPLLDNWSLSIDPQRHTLQDPAAERPSQPRLRPGWEGRV